MLEPTLAATVCSNLYTTLIEKSRTKCVPYYTLVPYTNRFLYSCMHDSSLLGMNNKLKD